MTRGKKSAKRSSSAKAPKDVRPPAAAVAATPKPPPVPPAPKPERPPFSKRTTELLEGPVVLVLAWIGKLVQQRELDLGRGSAQLRVTGGTRCPRCSGPSRLRTMTLSEIEIIEAAGQRAPAHVGPMAGRRCTSNRCGVDFLEMSKYRSQ